MKSFTVGELSRRLGVPMWRVRRTVDAVVPDAPRVGRYRVVPQDRLVEVTADLERRGYGLSAVLSREAE